MINAMINDMFERLVEEVAQLRKYTKWQRYRRGRFEAMRVVAWGSWEACGVRKQRWLLLSADRTV